MSSMLHRHTRLLGFEAQVSPLWETHWKGRLVVVSAFKTSQEQPRHTDGNGGKWSDRNIAPHHRFEGLARLSCE